MKRLMLVALAAIGLAACSGPTMNGGSDVALPGAPHTAYHNAPYDNTANSLGGVSWWGGGNG